MESAEVVPARGCPHYITIAFVQKTGQVEKCAGCQKKPLILYGQYGKSGPTNRQRTTKDPSGKQYLKRSTK